MSQGTEWAGMVQKIDLDHTRFRAIVKGAIRRDLRKHVANGSLIARRGSETVSIPMPQIHLPRFRFGTNQGGGVGQGEGQVGEPLGPGEQGGGKGEAGEEAGEHALEVEVSLEELARILGEELALPRIQPKGKRQITTQVNRYTGLRRVGPASLRHVKRTFKRALKREIASGRFGPEGGIVVPYPDDMRYRSWEPKLQPQSNAVIVYMMDVSGSMGDEQKEIVRIEAFWIDTWLKSQYRHIETRYVVHDAEAKEVDEHTFFHLRESGGTKISSAYDLCNKIIDRDYPPAEWNIYPFHFSDGDNWSGGDTARCLELLRDQLLPKVNVFCYGQVRSTYGSGQFKNDLDSSFRDDERVITSEVPDKDGIVDSIKQFLGTGR
jgi:sporulation protein YhbH